MMQAQRIADAVGAPVEEITDARQSVVVELQEVQAAAARHQISYTITTQTRLFYAVVAYFAGAYLTTVVWQGIPFDVIGTAVLGLMVAFNFLQLKCFAQLDGVLNRATDDTREKIAVFAQAHPSFFNRFSYTPGAAGRIIDFLQRMSGEIMWLTIFGIGVYQARMSSDGVAILAAAIIVAHLAITFAFASRQNRGADCLFVDQSPFQRRLRDVVNLGLAGFTLVVSFGFALPWF